MGAVKKKFDPDLRDWVLLRIRANPEEAWKIVSGLNFTPDGPNRMKASCPWHEDQTPSLKVNTYCAYPGTFKCFSCGRGGDLLFFVQELYGLSFPEALERIAELLKGGGS